MAIRTATVAFEAAAGATTNNLSAPIPYPVRPVAIVLDLNVQTVTDSCRVFLTYSPVTVREPQAGDPPSVQLEITGFAATGRFLSSIPLGTVDPIPPKPTLRLAMSYTNAGTAGARVSALLFYDDLPLR